MIQIGISDISKNPALIEKVDDIAEILNKKTKQIKGIFVPAAYMDSFKDVIAEVEYRKFVERNASLKVGTKEDDTLLDGIGDEY